jgi:hypothetical protein
VIAMKSLFVLLIVLLAGTAYGQSNLPACKGENAFFFGDKWNNCVGTDKFADGTTYVGEFKDGKLNGQVNILWYDGESYVGEFKKNKYNGQGALTRANGESAVGEFKDGKLNGQGTYSWADGDVSVGEFKDGKLNGQGTYTWADGKKYVGEFKDDKLNGQGIFYSANGKIAESGIFKDGKLVTSQNIDPNSFTRIANNNSAPVVSDSQRQAIEQRERQVEIEAQRVAEERRKLDEGKRQSQQAKLKTNEPMKFGPFISNFQASADFKTGHEAEDKARELFANGGIESNIDFAMSGYRDGLFIVSWQFFEPSMAFSADQLTSSIPSIEFVKKSDTKVFPSSTNNANRFEYAITRATGFSNDNLTFTSKGKSRLVGYWVNLPIQFKNPRNEIESGMLSVFYRGIEVESKKIKIDLIISSFFNSLEFASGFKSISYENYKAEIQKKTPQKIELDTEEKPTLSKVIPRGQINQPQTVKPRAVFKDCDECPEMVVIPAGEFFDGFPS